MLLPLSLSNLRAFPLLHITRLLLNLNHLQVFIVFIYFPPKMCSHNNACDLLFSSGMKQGDLKSSELHKHWVLALVIQALPAFFFFFFFCSLFLFRCIMKGLATNLSFFEVCETVSEYGF